MGNIWAKGASTTSNLNTAWGRAGDWLVQYVSSDPSRCRYRWEKAAWGSDWCLLSMMNMMRQMLMKLAGAGLLSLSTKCGLEIVT